MYVCCESGVELCVGTGYEWQWRSFWWGPVPLFSHTTMQHLYAVSPEIWAKLLRLSTAPTFWSDRTKALIIPISKNHTSSEHGKPTDGPNKRLGIPTNAGLHLDDYTPTVVSRGVGFCAAVQLACVYVCMSRLTLHVLQTNPSIRPSVGHTLVLIQN